jgi:hypothetical protein
MARPTKDTPPKLSKSSKAASAAGSAKGRGGAAGAGHEAMNILRNTILVLTMATSIAIPAGTPAKACGLIDCIVNRVAPGAGDRLDDWHNRAGRPLDDHAANQAAGAAANYAVPGSGPYVTEGLEMRDRYNRTGSVLPGRTR